ncbi:Protein of unknown function [Oceanobacillus limi]|uniref:DUF2624 domain-containing protein n=1 Tax=Oceanobacillus limi TaxID=930131 RepID=A0A1I0FRA9_9BACI|nr:DUF2624 domain-containing protein [Oceanobacillus limi]SET60943.1 Protein of unknown function [Oceanobacillus limi]
MSQWIKAIVINKMKQLTTEDIYKYGREYGFSITKQEATNISDYLKKNKIDPFDKQDHKKMLQELARITDKETAKKANRLFKEMIKAYGLESLFH